MFCTQCGASMQNAALNYCPQCGQETPESIGRRSHARRRLYRSRYDRKIAGVCGGLADLLDVDPTVIRLLAVGSLLFSVGLTFFIYIAAIIVIPEEPVMQRQSAQSQSV